MIQFRLCIICCVAFFAISALSECFYDGKIFHCSSNLDKISITDMSALNLSYRGLTELPSDILDFHQHITDLHLMSNLLRRIEDRRPLTKLKQLQHLDLTNNSLIFMNLKLFTKNPSLRILILNGNPNMLLSPSTAELPSLEELHLENCGLEALHMSTFRELKVLKLLNLQWNMFSKMPGGLSHINVIMFKGNPLLVGDRIQDEVINSYKDYYFGWAAHMDDLLVVQIALFIIAGVVMVIYYMWHH